MSPTSSVVLLLSDDFLWISRITGTARALGFEVKVVRGVEQLAEAAKQQAPACVILDLSTKGLLAAEAVGRVKAVCPQPPRFTAYGSHVDVATLKAAREAGCDPVLPRSQMAEQLPALLPEWLADNS
jgi:CheY-like chemotaxis protein